MITFVVATLAVVQAPVMLEPKIVSAIVLKSGLVMLTREAQLPAGGGQFRIEKIPTAYEGAFWYGTGASKVSDLKTSLSYSKKTVSRPVASLADLLKANVGKPVQLKVARGAEEAPLSGVIDEFNGSVLMLRNGDSLRVANFGSIVEVNVSTLTNKELSAEVDWPELSISFTSTSNAQDKFRILTLESGAIWAGSYLINLGDDRAEVDGKAQLALGRLAFDNVDVQLLAGSPQLMLSRRYDLATGIGSANDFLRGSQSLYRELNSNPLDPYERLGEVIRIAATALATAYTGFQGGGFGGGFVPQGIEQIQYDPTDNSIIVRGTDAFTPQGGSTTAANANENVYLYELGNVSLLPGERLTRPLFHVTTAYELVNVWTDVGSQTISKLLRLKNDSNLPLTPGSCMVLKDGKLLAMTSMPFASPTQSVDIEMGNVLDLKVASETTVTGTRQVANTTPPSFIYTRRKTIILEDPRDEEVLFEITTEVDGHIVDAGGAKVTAVARYFNRPPYFRQSVVWKVKVPARSIKELRVVFENRTNF